MATSSAYLVNVLFSIFHRRPIGPSILAVMGQISGIFHFEIILFMVLSEKQNLPKFVYLAQSKDYTSCDVLSVPATVTRDSVLIFALYSGIYHFNKKTSSSHYNLLRK